MLVGILVIGILIFVHELGHFLIAKYYRIGVLEFALGFGPRLLSFNWGETTYALRAIPLGGFVRMVGDDPRGIESANEKGELDAKDASGASPLEGMSGGLTPVQEALLKDQSRWFLTQGYLAKCAVVFAGPLFNLLFAWFLAAGLFYIKGAAVPVTEPAIIGDVDPELPAGKSGLKAQDKIISVDGVEVKAWQEFVDRVLDSNGKPINIKLERKKPEAEVQNGLAATETLNITVTPEDQTGRPDVPTSVDGKPRSPFRIGAAVAVNYEPVAFFDAVKYGGLKIVDLSVMTYKVLYGLVTLAVSPSKTIGGPIQIFKQTAQSAERGLSSVIWLMVFLNVMLAVMNLLPIPVLDGGHLVMFTLEKLKGGPLSFRFQEVATQIGMGLLMMLMIFALGNDIVKLFS